MLLTSALTHPNTILIYDFGRGENGEFYYAMEYVQGYDLRGVGPAARRAAARPCHQAAPASGGSLAEAHDKGLVHRDVKPSNLMITERGGTQDFLKVSTSVWHVRSPLRAAWQVPR